MNAGEAAAVADWHRSQGGSRSRRRVGWWWRWRQLQAGGSLPSVVPHGLLSVLDQLEAESADVEVERLFVVAKGESDVG